MPRAALAIIAIALTLGFAPAQATLSGSISDSTTGALTAGTTYEVTGNIVVPAGETLTIAPGVILKFNISRSFTIQGTLLADGVRFTSVNDDSIGVDLTPGSATVGVPGEWSGIRFRAGSDASVLSNSQVEFAGRSLLAGVDFDSANPTLNGITVLDCGGDGFDLSGNSAPTLTGCDVRRAAVAYDAVPISALPGFSGNTASMNSSLNSARVTESSVTSSMTIAPDNLISSVVHISASPNIPAGQTLTIGAGSILKLNTSLSFTVDGTLDVQGVIGNPVIFTLFNDDSAGGDTNADGAASTPTPGGWVNLRLRADSDASTLRGLEVRYAGRSLFPAIDFDESDALLEDCLVRDCNQDALDLSDNSFPTIRDCEFRDCGGFAVDSVTVAALPGFFNCVATGCAGGNYQDVTAGTLTQSTTVAPRMLIGAVMVSGTQNVDAGVTWTVEAGVTIKMQTGTIITIDGTLITNGTQAAPVTFTSLHDDTVGGDTNLNGSATTPTPGDWVRIHLRASSTNCQLTNTRARFAGRSGFAALLIADGTPNLQSVSIERFTSSGLSIAAPARPTVANCDFIDGTGVPVFSVPISALPGFSGNSATNNGGGNHIRCDVTTMSSSLTLSPDNGLSNEILFNATINVPVGLSLTLEAGLVAKFQVGLSVQCGGDLFSNGTELAPVTLTSIHDDSTGVDTRNDGLSALPLPGDWVRILFRDTSTGSRLEHTRVRYAGRSGFPSIDVESTQQFFSCVVSDCGGPCFRCATMTARPIVEDCRFDNGTVAIEDVPIEAVAGFRNNEASGNAAGDFLRIGTGTVVGHARIDHYNYPNGACVAEANINVQPGNSLTLGQGVQIKMNPGLSVNVTGRIEVLGTGYEPVVFTSLTDDEVGGDTNGDGNATVPSRGSLLQFKVEAGAVSNRFQHLTVRYAGRSTFSAVILNSASVRAESVRVDFSAGRGIEIGDHAGDARNFIAFDCTSTGIDLIGGTFNLVHATSVGNSRGVDSVLNWMGVAQNSIAWNNSLDNWRGFDATNLFNSNGDPSVSGINGNLNLDPLFLDEAAGNLNLQFTSPLINQGDVVVAFPLSTDFVDQPRVADGLFTTTFLPDMGAIEFVPYLLNVNGEPRAGEALVFRVLGLPGTAAIFFGTSEAPFIDPVFGLGLTGSFASSIVLEVLPVDMPYFVPLADDPALDGFEASVQAAVVPDLFAPRGIFTAVYRGRIFR